MRKRILSLFLAAVMLFMLSACGSSEVLRRLDAIDERLDNVEDRLEDKLEGDNKMEAAPKQEAAPEQAPLLSEQEALDIALGQAGLKESEVERLHIHLDNDDRRSEYDVDFHHGGYEYEFEIDARSGDILSYDKDRQ